MTDNNLSIVPIYYYFNANIKKRQIYSDNKGKTGIYRWTNIISGKTYIGSSINLSNRLSDYFSINNLKREIKKNKSKIYCALLKYGYSNFELEIIEYCDKFNLIEREQFYLDNLKPEYNILKFARSSFGRKHSIETIERIRIANMGRKHFKGRKHSIESIERIRIGHLGRKHSEATKLKMSANSLAHPVRVINNKTGEIKLFTSIRQAAKFIGIKNSYINICLRKNKFYKGRGYYITRNLSVNNN